MSRTVRTPGPGDPGRRLALEVEPSPPVSRMLIAVLALAGLLLSIYLTMYKLGMVGELVCGTGSCERVQDSPWGMFLRIPVAAWGVVGYGLLLALAIAGLQPRLAHSRGVAVMLFGASLLGVAFTAYLTYLEAAVIHAWCRWCLGSAAIIGLIFLCSIPGLRRAR
ncbi:MAG TPA: vitamin K epoxide reductase family protein [Longimicrobiaceae bacterium]|nr:vitamin K epoxide reductase family protein [Longimicrobiaceae bacterium]